MGLAALLIMIFHFYIPFSGLKAELVIYRAAYIGVDIFFLCQRIHWHREIELNIGSLWATGCCQYIFHLYCLLLWQPFTRNGNIRDFSR